MTCTLENPINRAHRSKLPNIGLGLPTVEGGKDSKLTLIKDFT